MFVEKSFFFSLGKGSSAPVPDASAAVGSTGEKWSANLAAMDKQSFLWCNLQTEILFWFGKYLKAVYSLMLSTAANSLWETSNPDISGYINTHSTIKNHGKLVGFNREQWKSGEHLPCLRTPSLKVKWRWSWRGYRGKT